MVGLVVESDSESDQYHQKEVPHLLFQLCIGNHCLFYRVERSSKQLPLALSGLLLDGKTLEEMLHKRFGLNLPCTVDINLQAALSQGLPRDRFDRYSLMKLAKSVLRDEGDLDWDEVLRGLNGGDHGTSVRWWDEDEDHALTDEKLRCGTFQAFLAYKMGLKFQATN